MRWIDAGLRSSLAAALAFGLVSAARWHAALAQQPAPQVQNPPAGTIPVPNASTPIPPMPPPPSVPAQPRFVVVVDAAHGGADSGAGISDHILEKDVVLSLSVRLRSTLASRGITVITTRESDGDVAAPNRAGIANHAAPAACISLHATASGNGVHLFTSSLGQAPASRFLPWQTAQAAYSTQSLRLSSEINSALGHAEIPVMLGRTSIQPMDSLACPAVALEMAPLAGAGGQGRTQVADAEYQRRVIEALAAALQQWRNDWRQQP